MIFLIITNSIVLLIILIWLISNRWVYRKYEEVYRNIKENAMKDKEEALERYNNIINKIDLILKQ